MFTLAHLSDVHLHPPEPVAPAALLGKRFLGYLSYRVKRKRAHDPRVLAALAADLRTAAPDHVAVTGDLTTIALPGEFPRAAAWLGSLGGGADVTAVPGNHDAYAAVPWSRGLALWRDFMTGSPPGASGPEAPPASAADFPFVRVRGPLALLGVTTAEPTSPLRASGTAGTRQLAALRARLVELGGRGLFRVVLIHHPPLDAKVPPRKRLTDSGAFARVVAEAGAELILHGHNHRSDMGSLPGPDGPVPVIGVPSASARRRRGREHAIYHLYRIARRDHGWRVEVEAREVTPAHDGFRPAGRFPLAVPGGAGRRPPEPGRIVEVAASEQPAPPPA